MAKYVAKKMGVEESGITFVQTKSAEREDAIGNGTVDYIVATYSITDARKEKVNFAGPYFIAAPEPAGRSRTPTSPARTRCPARSSARSTGSTSAQKVKDNYAADVALQESSTYTECVENLIAGTVDAVTTDDIILAGYAAQYPGELKIVGEGFSDENYGIGLKKGDEAGTDALNEAIAAMIEDGSWAAALEATVGPSERLRAADRELTVCTRRVADPDDGIGHPPFPAGSASRRVRVQWTSASCLGLRLSRCVLDDHPADLLVGDRIAAARARC